LASWINRAQTRIVGAASKNQLLATYIEVQGLIELLIAKISAEFDGVSTNNLAEVIGPLKRVANLGQLSFKVVAEAEAPETLTKGTPSRLAPSPG